MSGENTKPRRSLASLWVLLGLCIAPVAASYVAYYFWQPSGHVNYGDLLDPRPIMPGGALALADGAPFRWNSLKGKWVLLTADSGRCDARCQQKLVYLRQVRLAQGKESERIERVWLITDDALPDAALLAQHRGAWLIRASGGDVLNQFPVAGALADHIFVIDPLGNLMMRYRADVDPRNMVKDMGRLLRHSRWK